jgi:hypothetical protein
MRRPWATSAIPAREIRSARPGAGQLASVESDAAAGRSDQAHQRKQQGALAGAVATQHGQRLAAVDVEVDAVEHLALPVPGMEVTDPQ